MDWKNALYYNFEDFDFGGQSGTDGVSAIAVWYPNNDVDETHIYLGYSFINTTTLHTIHIDKINFNQATKQAEMDWRKRYH